MQSQSSQNPSELKSESGIRIITECELCGGHFRADIEDPQRICRDRTACELRQAIQAIIKTKKCVDCGLEKPLIEFGMSGRGYYRSRCKSCYSAQVRHKRKTDPVFAATERERDRLKYLERRQSLEKWCKSTLTNLRSRAKRIGILFELTLEDLLAAIPSELRCPALKVPLIFGEHNPHNASVDRIHPKLGYIRGNIKIISVRANAIKSNANADEILAVGRWLKKIEKSSQKA